MRERRGETGEVKEKIGECGRLVRKSKGFLPMNISNPKGVSFGAEEGK